MPISKKAVAGQIVDRPAHTVSWRVLLATLLIPALMAVIVIFTYQRQVETELNKQVQQSLLDEGVSFGVDVNVAGLSAEVRIPADTNMERVKRALERVEGLRSVKVLRSGS